MKRPLAFVLAGFLAAGCGGGANHLLPAAGDGTPAIAGAQSPAAAWRARAAARHKIAARVRVRIPRRRRGHEARTEHPASISALTQSIGIAVNGGAAQVFNATPSSPGCSAGSAGTTCTFTVQAAVGTDRFAVTTYSGLGGGGSALDSGIATVPIAVGKANGIAVTLGPVVTTISDSGMGSLRYAVATANTGDAIMFLLPANSTIALSTPITLANTVTIAGPGAASVTISGGGLHQIFLVTGTATISGLTLTAGLAATASTPGGAIWNTGTLVLADDVVGNSTSTVSLKHANARHRLAPSLDTLAALRHPHCTTTEYEAGGVYNNGTLTTSGTTFENNIVQSNVASCIEAEGGAIFNDVDGTISSSGDTFTGNSAAIGGAVANIALGPATFTGDVFNANTGCNANSGCPATGCTATACTSYAVGMGAAIFDVGAPGINVTSSEFENNVAGGTTASSKGFGGALYLGNGTPSVTDSLFSGNLAGGGNASCSAGEGGAIASGPPLVIDGDTFTNNEAGGDSGGEGGAILAAEGVQGNNVTFTANVVVGSGGACTHNAEAIGGAVFSTGGTTTLTASTFASNTATSNAAAGGGAIAAISVTLTNDSFTSNTAVGTGAGSPTQTAAFGGAAYVNGVAKVQDSTFTSNGVTIAGPVQTEAFGGAIGGDGTLTLGHDTFTSNSATGSGSTSTAAGGAVVVISGTQILSSGDSFTSNTATGATAGGGAAFVSAAYQFSGDTFTQNSATGQEGLGGALGVVQPGQVTNSTFTGNAANGATGLEGGGGAIYDTGGSNISGSTVLHNTATSLGGAVLATNTEILLNSTITGNTVTAASTATSGGGGIYEQDGLEVQFSTISNNSVTVSGTALNGGGGILDGGGLDLIQSTVSGNAVLGTSTGGGGGGGILQGAAEAIVDSTIDGNSSTLAGGGIETTASAIILIENSTLYQNAATGAGGNIDNPYAISLANSIVAGGTAGTGADIDNTGTITSGDYNIVQFPVAGTAIAGTIAHNLLLTDPQLLPLANNGGPTATNADQATSPGTGRIPFASPNCGSVGVLTDQRNFTRGAGGVCDVGAYEYAGVATASRHRLPASIPHTHGWHRNPRFQVHLHPIVLTKPAFSVPRFP